MKRRNLDMMLFLAYVGVKENRTTLLCKRERRLCKEGDYLGNGPAMMGPESTGSHACLQWAHCTSRAAALLAPEWVSTATEFLL